MNKGNGRATKTKNSNQVARLLVENAQLQTIVNSIGEGVFVCNERGIINYANKKIIAALGKDLVGLSTKQLIQHYQVRNMQSNRPVAQKDFPINITLELGYESELECYMNNSAGERRFVRLSSKPLVNEQGRLTGAIISYRDISRRKRSEHQLQIREQLYHTLVEKMNEGLIIVDAANTVQFINHQLTELLGFSEQEFIGKQAFEVTPIKNMSLEDFKKKIERRRQGISEIYELLLETKTGSERWFEVSASPLYNNGKEVGGAMAILSDITDRKKTEAENERLLQAIDSTLDLTLIYKANGEPIYINQAFRKMLGVTKKEKPEDIRLEQFVTKESLRKFRKTAIPTLKKTGTWQGNLELLTRRAKTFPVSMLLFSNKNKTDGPELITAIARDISDLEKARQEIAILARMPEENPAPALRVNYAGTIVYANPASEILLKDWKTRVGRKLPGIWQRTVKKVLDTGHLKEYEIDLGSKIFDLKLIPITDYGYVNFICSDITDKKQAEVQLKASEQKYRAIVEDQTELISRYLGDGTITFANKAYCRYYGVDYNKIVGKSIFDMVPEDSLKRFRKRLADLDIQNPVISYDENTTIKGKLRWQFWTDRAIFDDNDLFVEYQSVGQDITQLKEAEIEVKRNQEYLRQIIDTIPNIVYVKDARGRYSLVNKAFSEFYGIAVQDAIGKSESEVIGGKFETSKPPEKTIRDILNKKGVLVFREQEIKSLKEGTSTWFQTIKTSLKPKFGTQNELLNVSTDITPRKEAEDTLKFQLEFKELISSISTRFINLAYHEIDHEIEVSLKEIGQFISADRAVISLIDDDRQMSYKYSWVKNEKQQPAGSTQPVILKPLSFTNGLKRLKKQGYIFLNDLNKLSASDAEIRERSNELGVNSFIVLPLESKNEIIGFLSFSSMAQVEKYPENTITLLKIVSQIFSNAIERKNTEAILNYAMEFENIITIISANFINVDLPEINKEIRASLGYIGRFLNADFGFIVQFRKGNTKPDVTNGWVRGNLRIDEAAKKRFFKYRHGWAFNELKDNGVIAIADLEKIPPGSNALKESLMMAGVKAMIAVPIYSRGEMTGAVAFASTTDSKFWHDETIPLLKILGQVFANALERKQTEENLNETRELYSTLARNIPNAAVLLFDNDLVYRLVEGAALEEQGYFKDAIEGKSIYEVLPPYTLEILDPLYKKALNGEESIMEREFNNRHYLIHILPVKNDYGEIYAGMVMSLDISDLKEIQQKLENQTEELMRSNEDLELFAYAASHDLQEPLRMVSSYVHLIQRRMGKLSPEVEEYMDFAVDGVKRMQELINDLLEYSRVDRRHSQMQEVDLNKVMQLVQINLQSPINETGAVIKIDDMPTIIADQPQMISLIQNLLENAIKFRGKRKPQIRVKFSESTNFYTVSVNDNGIGIDPQYFDRIFTIFQRLNSRSLYSGTGIGLAVCKKIVERHGGSISVESELNKGSKFSFTISKQLTLKS